METFKYNNIIINYFGSVEKPYFIGSQIAKYLEYSNTKKAIFTHVLSQNKTTISEFHIKYNIKLNLNHQTILINKQGVRSLLGNCRMEIPKDLLLCLSENFNITMKRGYRFVAKETETLSYIKKSFDGENMKPQYKCGKYRLDFYFPKYKLAIECDEHGHIDRNRDEEIKRQEYIESFLNCSFIRYNPDDPNFSIFKVINDIYKHIRLQLT